MASVSDWKVPASAQPKPEDYGYDLEAALAAVVGVRANIPPDAFTADTLGTERAGNGVLIRPDGLVLTSTLHTKPAQRLLRSARIPIVELWELPDRPIDSAVGFSNRAAGKAMAEFLADTGRRRIGFIGRLEPSDTRGQLRREGYKDCLARRSLHAPRIVTPAGLGTDDPRAGAVGLAQMLTQWPDTSAVFCASDSVALGALSEARRRGLSVPGDIAIAGFGDFEMASEHGLALTTVRVPGFAIGAEAARLVSQVSKRRVVDLGFQIVRRMTA